MLIRSRLQSVDDQPVVLSASYFPLWLAKGTRLEQAGALPEGPDNVIEGLGHRFARGIEVLSARMPTPEEVQALRLPPGAPVVRLLHVDYDDEDRPLQVADDLYIADRHEFVFEWTEPEPDQEGQRPYPAWLSVRTDGGRSTLPQQDRIPHRGRHRWPS